MLLFLEIFNGFSLAWYSTFSAYTVLHMCMNHLSLIKQTWENTQLVKKYKHIYFSYDARMLGEWAAMLISFF